MTVSNLVAALALVAQPTAEAPKIVGVSMFKNGYAVVTRAISLGGDGTARVESFPTGSLGTLWFGASQGTKLEDVRTVREKVTNTALLTAFDQFLQANVGKTATLLTANLGTLNGKIVGAQGSTLILDENGAISMINLSEVRKISITGATTSRTFETERRVLQIKGGARGTVYMVSLERGITWAPNYSIDIQDDDTLTLTGKATVLNDLGELQNIEARFVTGFPNLPYAGLPDPLTYGGTVDQFIGLISGTGSAAFGGGGAPAGRRAEMMTQNAAAPAPIMDMNAMDPVTKGTDQKEELFFYKRPGLDMKLGDRAYFVLFRANAEYRRLYTWDVSSAIETDPYGRYMPNPREAAEEVWQTLTFKNPAGMPLTTGVATTFRDNDILGQDMMTYTSTGAEAQVKITKALDIHAERFEEETERVRAAQRVSGTDYDLVTVKGTLRVQNRKADTVSMRIRRTIDGELVSAEGNPKTLRMASGLRQLNPRTSLEWAPTVEPGKTVTLTYTYKLYVQR